MAKRKRYDIIGTGEKCPKCSQLMQRREHKEIGERILNQPFYFREWDYCIDCNHIQHYEYLKVNNDNKKSKELLRKLQQQEERSQQINFFNSI